MAGRRDFLYVYVADLEIAPILLTNEGRPWSEGGSSPVGLLHEAFFGQIRRRPAHEGLPIVPGEHLTAVACG